VYLNENAFLDFLKEKEITWIGIDFSMAKFTKKGFNYSQEILQHFMNAWNMLIISDQKKYDIRLSLRKPIMEYNLSMVTKKNKSVRLNTLLSDFINLANIYSEKDIIDYIKTLDTPQHSTYALMFLVESFDEMTKTGSVWVIILNANSHEVILCEKFLKKPGGLGTKNYWARVFYNLLFDIQKNAFSRWENSVKLI
jgi:hypothetical protein